MKNIISLEKKNNYKPLNLQIIGLEALFILLNEYRNFLDTFLDNIKPGETGLMGNYLELIIDKDMIHIKSIFCDNDMEKSLVTLPAETLRFIVGRWQELIPLKPDAITISEENGQYKISAEFKSSTKANNQ